MLFEISIFFILFSVSVMFFILISANTANLRASDAERLDILHDFLSLHVAPIIVMIALFLIPAVIVYGV